MNGRWKIIGTCWFCHHVVHAHEAVRVADLGVLGADHRPVRRLAHRGKCETTLRGRIGGRVR